MATRLDRIKRFTPCARSNGAAGRVIRYTALTDW